MTLLTTGMEGFWHYADDQIDEKQIGQNDPYGI